MLKKISQKIVNIENKFSDNVILIISKFFDFIFKQTNKIAMKSSVLILESDHEKNTIFELTFKGVVSRYKVTRSVGEFIELLMPMQWDFIFLEHDLFNTKSLSTDPESGYNALKFILENYKFRDDIKEIIIHTNNITGAKNMLEMSYVAGFDKIKHLIFNTAEFKAEVLKIKRSLDVI